MKNNAIPDVTAMAGIPPPPKLGIMRMLDASKKSKQVQGYQYGGEVDDFKYGEPSENGEIEPGTIVSPTYNSDGRLDSGNQAVYKAALSSSKQSAPVTISEYKPSGMRGNRIPVAQTLGDSRATTPSGVQSAEPEIQTSAGAIDTEPGDKVVGSYDASQDANAPKFNQGYVMPSSTSVPKASNYHQTGTIGDVSYNSISSRMASANRYGSNFGSIRDDRGGIYKVSGYQRGGKVAAKDAHPIGPKDTVPAMLQEGEFVLQEPAVNKIKQLKGIHALERLNAGDVQGFQNGGEANKPKLGDLQGMKDIANKIKYPEAYTRGTETPAHGFIGDPTREVKFEGSGNTARPDSSARLSGGKPGLSVASEDAIAYTMQNTQKPPSNYTRVNNVSANDLKLDAGASKTPNRPVDTANIFKEEPVGPKPESAIQKTINANTGVNGSGVKNTKFLSKEGADWLNSLKSPPLQESSFNVPDEGKDTYHRTQASGPNQPKPSSVAPKPGIFSRVSKGAGNVLKGAGNVAGKLAAPITAATEGMHTYSDLRDLKNPEDRANRVEEGVSRATGAIAGGTLGAAAGPVGSILGGVAGYMLPDAVNAAENTATKYYNKLTGKPEVAPNVLASDKAERIRQNKPTEDPVPTAQPKRELATDDTQVAKQNTLVEASNKKDAQNIRATGEAFKKDLANREQLQRTNGPVRSDYAGTPEGEREFMKQAAENMERQQTAIAQQRKAEYDKSPEGKEAAAKQQVRMGILNGYKRAQRILESPYSYGDSTLAAAKEQKDAYDKLQASDAATEAQAKKEAYENRFKDEDQRLQREDHQSRMDYYKAQQNDPKRLLEQQIAQRSLGAANGNQEDAEWIQNYNSQSKGKQNDALGLDYARKLGLPNADSVAAVAQVPTSWLNELTTLLGKPGTSDADKQALKVKFGNVTGLSPALVDAAVAGRYNDLGLNQQNGAE